MSRPSMMRSVATGAPASFASVGRRSIVIAGCVPTAPAGMRPGQRATNGTLTQHSDARVVLVDRRHGPGGHWLEAYPFVRLHQSSCFYGVASTLLGGGALQTSGPEAGLQERASQPEITAYYAEVLDRMVDSGRVELMSHSEFDGHRTVTSSTTGERFEVPESCP